jgi:hypothetical protein
MNISVPASALNSPSAADEPPEISEATRHAEARWLSVKAREFARGRDALFHGTRYRGLILASGFLKFAEIGSTCVCFSRSPEIAAFSATLPRDDDEGSGTILIFDRKSLKTRYKLTCRADQSERDGQIVNEFEERVYVRDVEIGPHLIGLVSTLGESDAQGARPETGDAVMGREDRRRLQLRRAMEYMLRMQKRAIAEGCSAS